jgi:hypothetical protein
MIIGFPALSLGAVAMGGSRRTDKKSAPKQTRRTTRSRKSRSRSSRPSKKSISN